MPNYNAFVGVMATIVFVAGFIFSVLKYSGGLKFFIGNFI